jgi:hypothetical protein
MTDWVPASGTSLRWEHAGKRIYELRASGALRTALPDRPSARA